MGQIPDQLPVISRGRHLEPEDGGCLMEIASLLAGERWSDAPRCTHPLLAAVARLVNDEVGDEARQELLQLVPELVGAVGDGPATAPAIVRTCARVGLTIDPGSRRLRHSLAVARTGWRTSRTHIGGMSSTPTARRPTPLSARLTRSSVVIVTVTRPCRRCCANVSRSFATGRRSGGWRRRGPRQASGPAHSPALAPGDP